MKCKLCSERGDTRPNAVCAFDGAFHNNYACGTLLALRSIIREDGEELAGVSFFRYDDQKYVTMYIGDIENTEGDTFGLALWTTWYKDRGRTEQVFVLSDGYDPRLPTEAELVAIVEHYKNKEVMR